MDLFPGYSEFSFSHHGPRGRAASPSRSHITSCPGFGEGRPSTPCRAELALLSHPGTNGNAENPGVFQGSSRSTPGPGLTGSTGHISHRQAQAADLMQKLLHAALHELSVGLQNAKETFPAPLETPLSQRNCSFLQEQQQNIPLCPALHQPAQECQVPPTPPTSAILGRGKPQLSPKTRAKIKDGKQ